MKRTLRILVLEGGGIFAASEAHFLGSLDTTQQNLEGIDVVSGCSAGGMLACAYATGQSFGYIDTVFQQRAKDCFKKRWQAKINPLACPTYDNDSMDKVLDEMIGKVTVGDIKNIYPQLKICVPAVDITEDKLIVFTNIVHDFDDVPLKDIAGYTSAAPTYFAGRDYKGSCMIDAGIIDVSGVLSTVCSIKEHYKIPFCNMSVLLMGAGDDIDDDKLSTKRYNDLGILCTATQVLVPYITLGNKLFTRKLCEGLGFRYFNYWNPLKTNGKLDAVDQIPDLIKRSDEHVPEFHRVWQEWLNA